MKEHELELLFDWDGNAKVKLFEGSFVKLILNHFLEILL